MEKKKHISSGKSVSLLAIVLLTAALINACSSAPVTEKEASGAAQTPAQNLVSASQTETPELTIIQPITPSSVLIDAPEGFIINEVGATDAEVAAIFTFMMDREYLPEKLDNCGFRLFFYARQDWHGGVLLAAGESERGEITAELYYIKNGELLMYTRGSDIWSINYTHFEGETIVYGKSFAWDNRPLATGEVTAEFYDGTAVTAEMTFEPGNEKEIKRGFICVAPSVTWLKSLEIKKDGKVITDDTSGQFTFSPENEPWYGEEESIRNRTRFIYAYSVREEPAKPSLRDALGGFPLAVFEDGTEQDLTYWRGCKAHEGLSPDMWRSNNGLYDRVEAKAGSRIAVHIAASPDSSGARENVGALEILEVYWTDLSVKDDAACTRTGELVCPSEKGFYTLILVTEHGCFTQMIRVA